MTKRRNFFTQADLVLCRSDDGQGGWSLHAPGSTDEQIASGDAPYLLTGDNWGGPTIADRDRAFAIWQARA